MEQARIKEYANLVPLTFPWKKRLTSAARSNGIASTMPYWDERVAAMAGGYPGVKWDKYRIGILTAHFVQHPDWFDVFVGSNLVGDMLSDLGPACTGTIAIAPSANINPERLFPSLFEPVHGSAPDIAGKALANPIGQIWCGARMLEHLGHAQAGAAVVAAIEKAPAAGPAHAPFTPDIGGTAGAADLGRAFAQALERNCTESALEDNLRARKVSGSSRAFRRWNNCRAGNVNTLRHGLFDRDHIAASAKIHIRIYFLYCNLIG